MICAMIASDLAFIRTARRGNNCRAQKLGAFNRGQANPASCPMNQNNLARLDVCAIFQRKPAGAIGNLKGSSIVDINTIRQGDDKTGIGNNHFGVTTPVGHRHHRIAGFNIGHAIPNGAHGPTDFKARRKRAAGALLIFALQDQGIGEIDTAGCDIDQNLTGLHHRIGHITPLRFFAKCVADPRLHADFPACCCVGFGQFGGWARCRQGDKGLNPPRK